MAWGASFRSCDALIRGIEENDPQLVDLIILPTKSFVVGDVGRLAAVLENGCNTHWRSLSASSHELPLDSLRKFGRAIANSKNQQLVELAIGHAEMGDNGVCALCEGLGTSSPLTKIDFSLKGMGAKGFSSVMNTLGRCIHLQCLDLSRNPDIGSSNLDDMNIDISSSISSSNAEGNLLLPQIQYLDLSGTNISKPFISYLFPKLESRTMRKLRLSNNPIEDAGFLVLLNHLDCIEELYLSNCEISDESMKALVASMSSSGRSKPQGIKVLDVSNNNITVKGASDLNSCLHNQRTCNGDENISSCFGGLNELNLARNQLDADGVQSIVDGLMKRRDAGLPNLTILDLSETNCGARGAVDVICNSSASTVRLFNNNLKSDGFHALAGSLRGGHPSIATLDLAGNNADQAAVVEVLRSVLRTENLDFQSELRTLVIGGNGTGDDVEAMIRTIKQVHPHLDILRDKPQRS